MNIFSNRYKVIDNVLKYPNEVVKFANQLQYYRHEENPYANGKYYGRRTLGLNVINEELFNNLCKEIIHPHIIRFKKKEGYEVNWNVAMYFSRLYAIDKPADNLAVIHKDQNTIRAGVIYLKENCNSDGGTTLYDDSYKKIKECKPKFNRGFYYNPTINHGPSKFVDDRLALIFFIDHLTAEGREYTLQDLN